VRLLITSDHFPPFIGGGHRWAALLATGLARRGHDVTVATMWQPGTPRLEHYGSHSVPVHRLSQLRTPAPMLSRAAGQRHSPPFPDPITIRDLRRVIRTADPEIVLSHGWVGFSAVPALAGTEIPFVVSAHDYGYFCPTRILLYEGSPCSGPALRKCAGCASAFYGRGRGLAAVAGVATSRRLTARRMAALQSVTAFVDDTTNRHLIEPTRRKGTVPRYIVPAFVDVDPPGTEAEVEMIVAQLPAEPFVLFVGALRPMKGVEVLFDAYRTLRDPPPLVLMGTVEADTPKPFPSGALVLTDVPHAAVMAAWDRALIGVVPSVWPEPLGTVAVEGISRGVPMIASVPSGMVDVLGDGVGILVQQGDPGALALALQSLIDDPARRQELSARGRAKAAEFDPEAVLSRYEQMLAEVIAAR
jgi:glycosyltransferase involved in cell wall biosynthesis